MADPRCPTCGPTTLEPHPRRAGVIRCANCKEHLAVADSTPAGCRTSRRCPIADDPCGPGGARPYCWETDTAGKPPADTVDASDQVLRGLANSLRVTSENPALVAEFLAHTRLTADASPADVLAAMSRLVLVGTGEFDEPCGGPECPCARREVANPEESRG